MDSDTYKETKIRYWVKKEYYGEYEGYEAEDNITIDTQPRDRHSQIEFISVYSNKEFESYSLCGGMIVRYVRTFRD